MEDWDRWGLCLTTKSGEKASTIINSSIEDTIRTMKLLQSSSDGIIRVARMTHDSFRKDGKLILFGNGGSASQAEHLAAEFVGRYTVERRPLPALALTTDASTLTAISNDYEYARVFERQIDALGRPNDLAIGLSTSGNSENVLRGIRAARRKRLKTVGLTGRSGGKLAKIVDVCIKVPSDSTPRIQESHLLIGHIICELVESVFR